MSPERRGRQRAAMLSPWEVFVVRAISPAAAPTSRAASARARSMTSNSISSLMRQGSPRKSFQEARAARARIGSGPVDA